jgi:tRNA-2-methylthio-N6-dimethylallyladenosine synthase
MTPPRTFHVKSFGCQMNAYDGARMAELLQAQGLEAAEAPGAADLVVLNTCHVRERAAEKVYSDIGRLIRREDGTRPMIAVAGCVAQAEGSGNPAPRARGRHRGRPAGLSSPAGDDRGGSARGARVVDTDSADEAKFGALPAAPAAGPFRFPHRPGRLRQFCTYCVVPYTRGAEISRPWDAIADEAEALVDMGAREITLLGQNVNAWTDGHGRGLHHLITRLDRIPRLRRIRYTTSHPNDMSEGLIRAHAEVEKLMPFLHLPVQSGSDRLLKAMNRSHSRDSYLRLLDRVRAARPDIALSGDFIVGFPGETEADFFDTLSLVAEVNYAQAYSFKYSPRPGTPAATMDAQIAPEVMDERLQCLQALLNSQQHAFNQASVGRRTEVLIERPGKKRGQMIGKSPLATVGASDERGRNRRPRRCRDFFGGPNSVAGVVPAQAKAA